MEDYFCLSGFVGSHQVSQNLIQVVLQVGTGKDVVADLKTKEVDGVEEAISVIAATTLLFHPLYYDSY